MHDNKLIYVNNPKKTIVKPVVVYVWKWNMDYDRDGHEKNGYMGEENITKDIW